MKQFFFENFPDLLKEWHPTKNATVDPSQVRTKSQKKYWWKCPEGSDHEWESHPRNRSRRSKCPFCLGRKLSVTNSFAAKYPDLVGFWHPTKNGSLSPTQILAGTNTRYWWKCPKADDHEWQSSCNSRAKGGGCPFCDGQRASVTNSLLTLYPEVASQWHPTKNGDLTPSMVVAKSEKKVWWKCSKAPDHEWQAMPGSRVYGTGCPFCSSHRVSVTNNLRDIFPQIANEWHPTKNGNLTPENVTAKTSIKYWWKCNKGPDHE